MNNPIATSMINNAALLLVMSIIYEVSYYIPEKNKKIRPYVNGIMIAGICIAIMMVPFRLSEGIVFDTRSIIISVTGFIFGAIPTIITAFAATVFRLYMGGSGALPGIIVILSSAVIGLGWRRITRIKLLEKTQLSIYIMSLVVHAAMLLAMLFLPSPQNLKVIAQIALPVMLIYPVASVVLGMLLIRQRDFREYQIQLRLSEERYQALFNEAPLPYQSLDDNGKIIDVNGKWLEMMGYSSKEEVVGTMYPDYLEEKARIGFKDRFQKFKQEGTIVCDIEMVQKDGERI